MRQPKEGDTRTKRIGTHKGMSLYVVMIYEGPPTFHRGDGLDANRNLLGALLIGGWWRDVGWVVGQRGAWYGYTNHEWNAWGRKTPKRKHAETSGFPAHRTVEEAAMAVTRPLTGGTGRKRG